MTYSIFTTTGKPRRRVRQPRRRTRPADRHWRSEPEAADDIFLVAQDDVGNFVGETIYGSSLKTPA
jgi:hypothetical protein